MKKLLCLAVLLAPSIAAAQPGYRGGGGYYAAQEGSPWAFHNGLTFEGNLGLGGMWSRDTSGNTSDTYASLGADIGIGGFLTPQLALTLRMASVNYSVDVNDGNGGTITESAIFVGPSLQYWVNPQFWVGGGIGYAFDHLSYSDAFGNSANSNNDPSGVALDLRAGFEFWRSFRNSLNVSVEYTPGFYKQDLGNGASASAQLNGFQVAFGYQFL